MQRFVPLPPPHKAALALASALILGLAGFSTRASTLLPDVPSWETLGVKLGDEYGYAVSGVGDVDNDGYADILVGAPSATNTVYREGAALAFHGSLRGLKTEHDWIAGSLQQGARFGCAIAALGDVNKDGFDDVLIGANRYNGGDYGGVPGGGAAFLFLGSPLGLTTAPTWQVLGEHQDDELGYALSSAGDLNGDTYLDLAIGVRYFFGGEDNEGQVRVYYGAPTGFNALPDWEYQSGQTAAALGTAVAGVGDLNGDGFADLAASAPNFNIEGDDPVRDVGAVYVFYGAEAGLDEGYDWMALGSTMDDWFGASIAGAGDLNHDGYDDLLVGIPGYDGDLLDQGAVMVYLGSADGLQTAPARIWTSQQTDSRFGEAVSSAGDINRDGYPDVIVGAPRYTDDQTEEGAIFVFFGRSDGLATEYAWRNFGQKAGTLFGAAVAAAGDVNNDRAGDILAGAPIYAVQKEPVGWAVAYYGQVGLLVDQLFIPLVAK